MTADVGFAELARQRDAENELLALLARGIREAVDSQRMPILRIVSAHEAPKEGTE